MSAYSLFLDENWDITLTSEGKIKTATGAYAIAQNASNAVRLFKNDAYFNAQKGIPHFDTELGHSRAALPVIESKMKKAMLAVDGVAEALAILEVKDGRIIGGNAYITLTDGVSANITL